MIRHKYLYFCPRGFRNEFTIFAIPYGKTEEAERWARVSTSERYQSAKYAEVRWITRREAERLTARERSNDIEYRRAGLNSYEHPVGATGFTPWEREERTREK